MSSGYDRLGANVPRKGTVLSSSARIIPKPPAPEIDQTLTSREASVGKGYTGDPCGNCQQLTLRISGHCYVCDTCGETTGCS